MINVNFEYLITGIFVFGFFRLLLYNMVFVVRVGELYWYSYLKLFNGLLRFGYGGFLNN